MRIEAPPHAHCTLKTEKASRRVEDRSRPPSLGVVVMIHEAERRSKGSFGCGSMGLCDVKRTREEAQEGEGGMVTHFRPHRMRVTSWPM